MAEREKKRKTEEDEEFALNEDAVKKEEEKLKKEVKATKDETVLTQLEDYIKTASYLGTRAVTPSMKKYVYRRRMDGLAILNTLMVDRKLKDALDFVVKFKPEEWTLVCKREAGWRAAKMFSELTGVRLFTKKYPAGVLTNTELPNFFETKMIFICDPWIDKNALADARRVHLPVVGVCNTNNHTNDIDYVIIGNNHSNKSLGLIFWLLAREYLKAHGIKKDLPSLEDFAGEELILEEPKKKRKEKVAEDKLKSDEQKIEERMKQLGNVDSEGGEEVRVGEGAKEGV